MLPSQSTRMSFTAEHDRFPSPSMDKVPRMQESSQFIPVRPNTDYEFSAESRTEDIDTASGPRFAIADAYTNSSYVLTDDVLGTNPWRLQQARFHTGPNTNLLLLKIVRQPAAPLIRGKLWIDDVRLVETTN